MITINIKDEIYIINKDNMLYVEGFKTINNSYTIIIYFSSLDNIHINDLEYQPYIDILLKLKKED